MSGLLSKDRIIARPGYSRWLIPPAALAIHLCIGQAYAISVFNFPLSTIYGRAAGLTDDNGLPISAPEDWPLKWLGWIFSLAIVFLGLSAAFGGRWLEKVGPRMSGVVSACCWGSGFFLSAYGVYIHNIWLIYFAYGILGGCGLGLGYITPVSTLIKWFPDRRGMATGMAIMGFGGGAMIASPLSEILMQFFTGAPIAVPEFLAPLGHFLYKLRQSIPPSTTNGVSETFLVLGAVYLVAMLGGAFLFRLPPPGWRPEGWTPPPPDADALITSKHVHPNTAIFTMSFWLLWGVLFLNVTAGIGVLGQASPMIQEMFPGHITAEAASGFVGLLSLFNLVGRFFWASISDKIGRKPTYAIFFLLGTALYTAVPFIGQLGSVALFVAAFAVILTMYGGGFATIPAYLSDIFGTQFVGAIHGRLLTAWSLAGVAGPALVNYIREFQIEHGVAKAQAYNVTMWIMASLLVIGFFCNLFVAKVDEKLYMTQAELEGGKTSTSSNSSKS